MWKVDDSSVAKIYRPTCGILCFSKIFECTTAFKKYLKFNNI